MELGYKIENGTLLTGSFLDGIIDDYIPYTLGNEPKELREFQKQEAENLRKENEYQEWKNEQIKKSDDIMRSKYKKIR